MDIDYEYWNDKVYDVGDEQYITELVCLFGDACGEQHKKNCDTWTIFEWDKFMRREMEILLMKVFPNDKGKQLHFLDELKGKLQDVNCPHDVVYETADKIENDEVLF